MLLVSWLWSSLVPSIQFIMKLYLWFFGGGRLIKATIVTDNVTFDSDRSALFNQNILIMYHNYHLCQFSLNEFL